MEKPPVMMWQGYTLDTATLDHVNSHVSRYGITAAKGGTHDTAIFRERVLQAGAEIRIGNAVTLNLNANHTLDVCDCKNATRRESGKWLGKTGDLEKARAGKCSCSGENDVGKQGREELHVQRL